MIYVIGREKEGDYLRISKFKPGTDEPVYGPIIMAWFTDILEQAQAQCTLLGEGHKVFIMIDRKCPHCGESI